MKKVITLFLCLGLLLSNTMIYGAEDNIIEENQGSIYTPMSDSFGVEYYERISERVYLEIDGVKLDEVYIKPQLIAHLYKDRTGTVSVLDLEERSTGAVNCSVVDSTFKKLSERSYRISIDYKGNTGRTGITQSMTVKAAQKLVASGEVGFKSIMGSVSTKAELMASSEQEAKVEFTYVLDGSYYDNVDVTFYIDNRGGYDVTIR